MAEKQKEMTVTELTTAIVSYIVSKNYSPSYIDGLQLILSRLNTYCTEKGIIGFSTEIG